MVLRAKEYIAAGDIFQVVLSQRFEVPFGLAPFALYRALRRVNPSPYLFFLDCGTFAVAGSSPEILVKTSGGTVTIRPVAGTRPRGATPHEDKALEDELLADPKERAEHLMLLDLGRNDVGRVAEIQHRQGHRSVFHRALQPGDAHRLERRRQAAPGLRSARCAGRGFSRRYGVGRAQGPRHADHRRTGEGESARTLCRQRRLFLRRRHRYGHLHRAAHGADQGRHHVCSRPAPASSPKLRSRRSSSRNASTRPRRHSAPPKKPSASLRPRGAGSKLFRIRIEPRVTARSDSDEAIQLLAQAPLDCFSYCSAMTIGAISPCASLEPRHILAAANADGATASTRIVVGPSSSRRPAHNALLRCRRCKAVLTTAPARPGTSE